MAQVEKVESWVGTEVVDSEGEKVGKLEDVYFERKSGEAQFGSVKSGMLGRHHVVPLKGASFARGYVRLPFLKELALSSPAGGNAALTRHDHAALQHHFSLESAVDAGADEDVRFETASATRARQEAADADMCRAEALKEQADGKDREASERTGAAKEQQADAAAATAERDRLLDEAAKAKARAEQRR